MSLFDVRREYEGTELREDAVDADPFAQFQTWFNEAVEANVPDVTAMALATSDTTGRPSARTVLLKHLTSDGLVFFTNFESAKARELDANPQASLLFYWTDMHRQIRFTGSVTRVDDDLSDTYFRTRPRDSQLSAWASNQSDLVPDRAALEAQFAAMEVRFPDDGEVPRPPNWGGYCVQPDVIEFWQGRTNRLHDRLRYTKQDNGAWTMERLAP